MEATDIEISQQVKQFFTDYCEAVDERNWQLLDSLFTDDAFLNYDNRLFGLHIGNKGKKQKIIPWLKSVFTFHTFTSHIVTNIQVDKIDKAYESDCCTVTASAKLANYQTIGPFAYFCAGNYQHEFVYHDGTLKSKQLSEKAGVFAPVLSFELLLFVLGLSVVGKLLW